jgi:hypothetical protein
VKYKIKKVENSPGNEYKPGGWERYICELDVDDDMWMFYGEGNTPQAAYLDACKEIYTSRRMAAEYADAPEGSVVEARCE